jgi:U4/U6.U5 tri-snRNP-associated protein 2
LIIFFKRFEKNQFFVEKNTTIVNFPINDLSFEDICLDSTKNRGIKYNLISNIIHDGKFKGGSFRIQVKNKAFDKWFDIQDLNVNPIMAQSVLVSESYIHLYEGN